VKWTRRLTWLGVAIAVFGVVQGIWVQLDFDRRFGNEGSYRMQLAGASVSIIAFGALLAVAAQIMGVMQATQDRTST
jgi:hypothetical protein